MAPDGYVYPNGATGNDVLFDFTLLGPRVPAILISPWLDPAIDATQYQHTSILRFVQELVRDSNHLPSTPHLTGRDEHATSFASVFQRHTPRPDCPVWIDGYGADFNWPVGYISNATNTRPIVITVNSFGSSAPGHFSPPPGSTVIVSGVEGNTAANGTWLVAEGPKPNEFRLMTANGNYSEGNGTYVPNTGTWAWPEPPGIIDPVADGRRPPAPHVVDLFKQYLETLPGHPDSGKPITRTFPTKAGLGKYTQERYRAAREHYARTGAKPKS